MFQNLNLIDQLSPDLVLIFSADHIYKMNIRQMVEFHRDSRAKATVASLPVAREEGSAFGILDVDAHSRVKQFIEKPSDPPGIPDDRSQCLVSMGNYAFEPKTLVEALHATARTPESHHDFG